jgi:hypothetical protein
MEQSRALFAAGGAGVQHVRFEGLLLDQASTKDLSTDNRSDAAILQPPIEILCSSDTGNFCRSYRLGSD